MNTEILKSCEQNITMFVVGMKMGYHNNRYIILKIRKTEKT